MTMKVTLPPIPNSVNTNSRDLGSFDPFAFRKQFSKGQQYTAYKEIASLSTSIESLQKENNMMRSELFDLVTTQDSPFFQMKRSILEFEARLTEREKEAAAFKKYYNGSSVSSTPTFVEVDVHKDKQASFDLVATSLLVCNEQRNFFKANDLRRQNEELLALIEHQQEALKMAQSRLQLYWQCQHQNGTQLMLDSLKRKIPPPELADAAPNQLAEQKMKIKILSNELRRLVKQRKELVENGAFPNRIKNFAKQRNEMAIKIQKIVRGFLTRLHSPLPRKNQQTKQEGDKVFQVHEPPQKQQRPPRNNKTMDNYATSNENNEVNNSANQSIENTDNNNQNVENTEVSEVAENSNEKIGNTNESAADNNTENKENSNNENEVVEDNSEKKETPNSDNNNNENEEIVVNDDGDNLAQPQAEPTDNDNNNQETCNNDGDTSGNDPNSQE